MVKVFLLSNRQILNHRNDFQTQIIFSDTYERKEKKLPISISNSAKIAFLSRSSMPSFMHDKMSSKTIPLFIKLISFRTVKKNGQRTSPIWHTTHSMFGPSRVSLTSKNQDEFSCNRLVKLSSTKLDYILYKETLNIRVILCSDSYQIKRVTMF